MKSALNKKPNYRKVLILSACAVLAVLFITYKMWPEPVSYQTIKVEKKDIEQSVLATGQLDAVRKVDVGAQVSGQMQKLYVEIGDSVTQGQLLAVIDPQQAQNQILEVEASLEELNAQLTQAKAELKFAEVTLARQQKLAKVQAVSRQELDRAVTEVAVKKASIGTINAQVNKSKASLDTAKINLDYTKIVAPMDGEVVQITTLEGQTVIAAQQAPNILTLANMGTMLVKAQVSEADVIRLKPGQPAWFTVLGDPTTRFQGTLKDIQPTPEKVNDAIFYYARFEVPNEKGLLRLQMTAQVHIILAGEKQVLAVPLAALGEKQPDGRYKVAILNKDKEEERLVTIGARNNVDVHVISGLKEGDNVIISRGAVEEMP